MKIVLLTPRRRFIANEYGLGYQVPLGLVLIGGPLVDAGHQVRLIDNDAYGWSDEELIEQVRVFSPDAIFLGHTGSTAAHTVSLRTARALRGAFPEVTLVYGGVYPSYAAEEILGTEPAIDIVVRGEGEETCVQLAAALQSKRSLASVEGIVWRDGELIRVNGGRRAIEDLDAYRPGWELVDWTKYELLGVGRAAGIQFSRGCPLTCTYCGQWAFWKKWRHRSPANFVEQLRVLREQYGVRIVWLADENFAADRAAAVEVLERLRDAKLDLSLNLNMTAADVARDAELLPLYKAAGVEYVVMGVESLEDEVVEAVRKNNPFETSRQAVAALRRNGMISLVNIIYGLEDETPRALLRKFGRVLKLDPDILNAVYLTPHFWTQAAKGTAHQVIQLDMAKWTYRNQVLHTSRLKPWQLFAAVKLTEALFHLRPRALARLFTWADGRVRTILRQSMTVGVRVLVAEIAEFLFDTRFAERGKLTRLPGARTRNSDAPKRAA